MQVVHDELRAQLAVMAVQAKPTPTDNDSAREARRLIIDAHNLLQINLPDDDWKLIREIEDWLRANPAVPASASTNPVPSIDWRTIPWGYGQDGRPIDIYRLTINGKQGWETTDPKLMELLKAMLDIWQALQLR